MALITLLTVPTGPYFGFTLAEIETELDGYKAERKALNSALSGASMNGQSFQFADLQKQRAALDQKQNDLQVAFNYLDPGRFPFNPPTDTAAAVIR